MKVISNYLMRSYKLYEPSGNYSTVFDGINVEHYYENKEIFKNDSVRIAIIGTINPQKNQLEAVEAFELLLAKGRKNIDGFTY